MATFIFYSHSDNIDLWPYICKSIAYISDEYTKVIAVNDTLNYNFSIFDKIIMYDDSLTYDKKLLDIFSYIDSEYIVMIHDNDLIVTFDNILFKNLLNTCISNNIDRCMFGVIVKNPSNMISISNEDSICKINNIYTPHFKTPYDVSPSIWKLASYILALKQINNVNYRDIEQSYIVEFCNKYLNIYGFVSHHNEKPYYVIGRPFYHKFQFLHIYCSGKLLERHLYMDQQRKLNEILTAYPDIQKRNILYNQHHININNRTV